MFVSRVHRFDELGSSIYRTLIRLSLEHLFANTSELLVKAGQGRQIHWAYGVLHFIYLACFLCCFKMRFGIKISIFPVNIVIPDYTRLYPKVSGLAAWSGNCKWYSSLPLGAVVSLFCESL